MKLSILKRRLNSVRFRRAGVIYIYIHTHTHTHIYIYIYICVCVCVRACEYVCMYVYTSFLLSGLGAKLLLSNITSGECLNGIVLFFNTAGTPLHTITSSECLNVVFSFL